MSESGLDSLACAEFARQQCGEGPSAVERGEDRIPDWWLAIERNAMVKHLEKRTRFGGTSRKHVAKYLGDSEHWCGNTASCE
jgi:hypothetical protein